MLQTRSIESYSFRYSSFCSFVCMKPPLYPDSSLMDAEILSHVLYSVRVKSIYSCYLVQFKYNNRVLFPTIYQVLRKIFQVQFFPLCVINIYIFLSLCRRVHHKRGIWWYVERAEQFYWKSPPFVEQSNPVLTMNSWAFLITQI